MTSIKTERITARVSESIKDTLGLAANLMGATLNQFLVQAAIEKAENIIERDKVISLSRKDAQLFFDILDSPLEANKKLKSAFNNYKRMIE